MKVFKNNGDRGNYYITSFYHKDQTGDSIKRTVYVGYQKGTEPLGEYADYDLIARDKETGAEYSVILDCYKKNEFIEPKLFMIKPRMTQEQAIANTEKRIEENNREVKVKEEELPFY